MKTALTLKDGGGRLSVRRLCKSYRRRPTIHDVSLHLDTGEVVALLGPNGSGKTTTFHCVAGLVMPDAGHVVLDDQDVTFLPMYRRARAGLGYLPQETSIFRGLSVEQNIRAVLEISERSASMRAQMLEDLLSAFHVEHLRRAPALALSGGERRRVEIARAMACRPRYLLLDEPFAGVDPIAVDGIRTLVLELTARSVGVLITDHNVRETLEIVDRAYILNEGRVLMSGSADDVTGDRDVRRLYLGDRFSRRQLTRRD